MRRARTEDIGGRFIARASSTRMHAVPITLLPAFSVVVPHPLTIRFPLACSATRHDVEWAVLLGIWIDLQLKNGTIQALYDHWILGRDARPRHRIGR